MTTLLDALSIKTPLDFAHALEGAEGWPQTADNDAVLVAWQQGEGAPGWGYNNPFNTTQRETGDGGAGVAGITRFTSWNQGVQGTVDALLSGRGQWYAAIRNDLANGAPAQQTAHDIEASPWAGGHYGATAPNFAGGNLERILGSPGWTPANVPTPAGSSTDPSGSSSTTNTAQLTAKGLSFNPLTWIGSLFNDAKGSIAQIVLTGIFLAAGAALIVLGAWRSVSPDTRQQIKSTATTAATVAAA
jgi:hypothetical protein